MRRWPRAALAYVAVLSGVLSLVPLLAGAGHLDLRDPSDTAGLLDVKLIDVNGSKRVRWEFVTYNRWTAGAVENRGFFVVSLDTFSGSRFDYYLLARSHQGRVEGLLFRDRKSKPDYVVTDVGEWRSSRRNLFLQVRLSKMRIGRRRTNWTWRAQTLFTSRNCRQVCFDRVPDEGRVSEPVPGATPTPTVTVDPTVTP